MANLENLGEHPLIKQFNACVEECKKIKAISAFNFQSKLKAAEDASESMTLLSGGVIAHVVSQERRIQQLENQLKTQ